MAESAPRTQGDTAVPNSRVSFRRADENSESVVEFDCGDAWYEREINKTVREAKWANRGDVDAYEFFADGKTLGFAFFVVKEYSDPWWDSPTKAWVRYIYTLGINKGFKRKRDSHVIDGRTVESQTTLADAMMRAIESMPRGVTKGGKHVGEVVSTFLTVYTDNEHAIKFYGKVGYEQDTAWGDDAGVKMTGPDKDKATIAMRKRLPQK